jgi:thiol-disulfide isomerase/thioredoxin
MTDAPPHGPSAAPAPEPGASPAARPAPALRKPRKIFLVIGIVLAAALGVGLFTGLGTSQKCSGGANQGCPVPAFSAHNVGTSGPSEVAVPADGGGKGTPAVLLFFGSWCSSCKAELPPLAATVKRQEAAHGSLARIRVIGVDTLDSPSGASAFIATEGVTFPVAFDPDAAITQTAFQFHGDPYTVFVRGDGTIAQIVAGAQLTPSSFTTDERALIPSGT